jgi:protein O-GlcNAc transferase
MAGLADRPVFMQGTQHKQLTQSLALLQRGRFAEAEAICVEILRKQPRQFDALHLLGVAALRTNRAERSVELFEKAIGLDPCVAAIHFNLGNALRALKRHEQALASYDKAIALKQEHAEAHASRAITLWQLGRREQALECYETALALDPDQPTWNYNLGNMLVELQRHEEALASYDRAIVLKRDYVEAYANRGNVLRTLKRYEEALASLAEAIVLKPNHSMLHFNRGHLLRDLARHEQALTAYDTAIAVKPGYAEAYADRGKVLWELKRHLAALASLDEAIRLKPDCAESYVDRGNVQSYLNRREEALANYTTAMALNPVSAEAYNNAGIVLGNLDQNEQALASYDKAIALRPDYADAHYNRGNLLQRVKRHEHAIASFERAIAVDRDRDFLHGTLIFARIMVCDWDGSDEETRELFGRIECGKLSSTPFSVLSMSNSPGLQRRIAGIFAAAQHPRNDALPLIAKRQRRNRIRLGYFSSDFRDHAVAHLIVQLFECHDRSHFEVTGFSFGPDTGDAVRQRLIAGLDHFIDVQNRSDQEVAMLAREAEIDIAIDLNGFTQNARTDIFAFRAAPIQVNYLGYPGTMGAEYIDYLIADPILIPTAAQKHYSEKIACLPDTYQANDTRRAISERIFARAEVGLPQTGFIFCCFNHNYKIAPEVFDCWMKILGQVEGSVLWLLEDTDTAVSNLRTAAMRRGIVADRLIFAPRVPLSEHLARHRTADLFLDTLPYNAHTTASDALWAGLPVLTRIGETFAGRVAASLLHAIGLPELVTATSQAYEALAIEFANDPAKLGEIRRKLDDNRLTSPLFNTKLYTRHIEAAYTAMYDRYQTDLPPDHIIVHRSMRP